MLEHIWTFGGFLSFLTVSHMWMMGDKLKYAPLFGLVIQALWFYYAVYIVKDHGLLIGVVGFSIANIRNQIKWWRE